MPLHIEFIEPLTVPQEKLVRETLVKAAARITGLLPLSDVHVKIRLDEKLAIPEYGVGGWCFNDVEIGIALSPNRESDWSVHLPRALAHEWHHLARWRGPGYGRALVDSMISEGLAQHFEIECFAGVAPFYSTFLSQEQRTAMFDAFIAEAAASGYDHSRWFFGTSEFPFLAGYDLSFFLLGQFLRFNRSVASRWVALTSVELLEFLKSGHFKLIK